MPYSDALMFKLCTASMVSRIDMCMDKLKDMCAGMCSDMYGCIWTDMILDMLTDMCTDMCTCMCLDMCMTRVCMHVWIAWVYTCIYRVAQIVYMHMYRKM